MPPAKNTPNKPEDEKKIVDPTPAPVVENHDETDVAAALARETQDGKGADPVPESDFQSHATEGVEKKEKLLSTEEVTQQVLDGRWGSTAAVAENRLKAVGYDVAAVAREFKRRKDGGAPSAF